MVDPSLFPAPLQQKHCHLFAFLDDETPTHAGQQTVHTFLLSVRFWRFADSRRLKRKKQHGVRGSETAADSKGCSDREAYRTGAEGSSYEA